MLKAGANHDQNAGKWSASKVNASGKTTTEQSYRRSITAEVRFPKGRAMVFQIQDSRIPLLSVIEVSLLLLHILAQCANCVQELYIVLNSFKERPPIGPYNRPCSSFVSTR
jgi:hypothetical protein